MGLNFFGKCFWRMVAESVPKSDFPERLFLKTAIKTKIRVYRGFPAPESFA